MSEVQNKSSIAELGKAEIRQALNASKEKNAKLKAEAEAKATIVDKPTTVPYAQYEETVNAANNEIQRINNIAMQFREQVMAQNEELRLLRGGYAIKRIEFFLRIVENRDLYSQELIQRIHSELEGELFPIEPEVVEGEELTEGAGI